MTLSTKVKTTLTIDSEGAINVRTVTVIYNDGVEIAQSLPHRKVITPGQSFTQEVQMTKDVANALHTPARVNAYRIAHNAHRLSEDV